MLQHMHRIQALLSKVMQRKICSNPEDKHTKEEPDLLVSSYRCFTSGNSLRLNDSTGVQTKSQKRKNQHPHFKVRHPSWKCAAQHHPAGQGPGLDDVAQNGAGGSIGGSLK